MQQQSEEGLRRIGGACLSSVSRTFSAHFPLYLCTLSFGSVTGALLLLYRLPFPLGSTVFFLSMIAKMAGVVAGVAALKHLHSMYRSGRPDNPLSFMLARLMDSALTGDRFGNVLHGLIAFTPLMMMFAVLKVDIARIHPFAWDRTFMHLGLVIGFGHHYWQMLQPILGYPPITTFLSFAYGAWFPVMFTCLFWQLTRSHMDLTRAQFLLAYAFAWFFGGFVIATIFSSAGPCFYSHFAPDPNPYEPLLHYLRVTREHWPIWTVDAQDELWQSYLAGQGDVQGISAMPSMHVMVATLLALLGWRTNRRMGVLLTAFAVTIFIASIMLGWHYSVDEIAGVTLGLVFWWLAGRVSRAWASGRERTSWPYRIPAVGFLESTDGCLRP